MLVLGLDPGTTAAGYGLVRQGPGGLTPLGFGILAPGTEARSGGSGEGLGGRLLALHGALAELLDRHEPDLVAVEELFFTKNIRSGLAVAQARGVLLLAAAQAGIPVVQYGPLQVKQAVTGYGRAEKAQVQAMVARLLNLEEPPRPDDAADALAVAICAALRHPLEAALAREALAREALDAREVARP